MSARHVRHLLAAAVATGAVVLLPATASAHPEACADATLASMPSGSAFENWGEVYEVCLSEAAVKNFDDSGARLESGDTAGTSNLKLVFNRPKSAPFDDVVTNSDLNSDLAFEDGHAFQGNYDGIQVFDVRTDCGSHTHTVIPEDDRLLIYVSSYDSGAGRVNCEGDHDKISIVEVRVTIPRTPAC